MTTLKESEPRSIPTTNAEQAWNMQIMLTAMAKATKGDEMRIAKTRVVHKATSFVFSCSAVLSRRKGRELLIYVVLKRKRS